ncbi:hypothetical protein [Tabrizicola sp.]|jgi:hypothetical protein|uniref:hypothetical protein n=1 Tax=Tabrizicola sp. TaxID=2005166 RepID=UPI0025DE5002|nr:hypothetical protein [Tabrizicola sp.]MBY0351447.1 hypothetical protein [Tabrizicola sp.]
MTLLVTGDSGGPAPHWRRPRRARLAALASLLLGADPAWPQSLDNYQVAGSVAAYLGVVPSEIVQGHPLSHPEGRMHGGAPGGHSEHIVVALFEDPSGARIEDATVTATIAGRGGLGPETIVLEKMPIVGLVTYGGFFGFAADDTFSIDLLILRPGSAQPTRITFAYEHGAGN